MKKSELIKGTVAIAGSLAMVGILALAENAFGGTGKIRALPEGALLTREYIEYVNVDAPEASSGDGVVSAEEWSASFPEIYNSFKMNEENTGSGVDEGGNTYRISYIDEDPYIVNLYDGYGFAKDYTEANGHNFGLEDVYNTERPHALANCMTCKTANFTKLVNDVGDEAYSYDFQETWKDLEENTNFESISCYSCHANEAGNSGKIVITQQYINERLAGSIDAIDTTVLSCGQCHIEYYFKPDNKATSVPYTSEAEMSPDAILEYYNSIGFADWTQESTGTALLKAQHPEMETFIQGKHYPLGLNCADCHMEIKESEDGKVYHSHEFISPLKSEAILQSCAECHKNEDMVKKVEGIQAEITARETEVGEKVSELNDKLTEAVEAGMMSEEDLNKVREIYRAAQWYWDYDYVENSEGAHNSTLAKYCLDTAESKAEEGLALLG